MKELKTQKLSIRMTETERFMLDVIAQERSTTVSDFIRTCISNQYEGISSHGN